MKINIYVLEYPFSQIVNEFSEVSILTGWITFFVFIPLAITSTDAAIKRMGPAWKKLQRWVYLAAVMAFAHWALLGLQGEHASIGGALFHFAPVMLLQVYRVWKQRRECSKQCVSRRAAEFFYCWLSSRYISAIIHQKHINEQSRSDLYKQALRSLQILDHDPLGTDSKIQLILPMVTLQK